MTKEIMEHFASRQSFIPDAKLTQAQRNTMIGLEQKGIVFRTNESFLGGAPETFWFVDKAKLQQQISKPPPATKPKTTAAPKRKPQRRTTRKRTKAKGSPIIRKWEIGLGIFAFLIILFS